MKGFCIFIFLGCVYSFALGQCLTDLKKIFPQRTAGKDLGSSQVATGGDYLVIGNPLDDTTGYVNNGAAYVYEKSAAGWDYRALLKPSNVFDQQFFGYRVAMDSLGNSLAVISFGSASIRAGEIYVYQRPSGGWTDSYETDRIKLADTLSNASVVRLSPDGTTLVVGQSQDIEYGQGQIYIYKRNNLSENFSSVTPTVFKAPGTYANFGNDIAIDKEFIIVGAQIQFGYAAGAIFIYKNKFEDGYPLVATLKADQDLATFGQNVKMKGNLIATKGLRMTANEYVPNVCFFEKKGGLTWSDTITVKTAPLPEWNADIEILDSLTVAYGTDILQRPSNWFNAKAEIVATITKKSARWVTYKIDTIYQEETSSGYSITRGFRSNLNSISWNGSQLVVVPTMDSPNSVFANSVLSMTRSNGIWGSFLKIRLPFKNSTNYRFGNAVAKTTTDELLVVAPTSSEIASKAGVIEVFQNNPASNWSRVGSIKPPWQYITDTFFGNSISVSDSMLAVGAVNYGYINNAAGNNFGGSVYLYKRTGSSWVSNILSQSLAPPPDVSYSFGSSVGISSRVLAVSAFSTPPLGGTNNVMAIYERKGDSYDYVQTFDFGNAWSHGQNSKIFVRNDSIFAFSGLGGYAGSGSGVYIFTKDPTTRKWGITSTFDITIQNYYSFDLFNFSNTSLEVSQNHVFIGVPGLPLGNVPNVGRVFVYTKLPGSKWPAGTIPYSSIIYPRDTVSYGYFGYSLANSENTLVIGAPGTDKMIVNFNQVVDRNSAGAAYVITAEDYSWTKTTQLVKLQGTEYNKPHTDHMGLSVASDNNFYFSGAPYENNDHGVQAGAVYTIPTPPLVKLIPPMCQGSLPQQLFGYPFGGTWSGQGLVAGSNGVFDPSLVGPGKYLLSYKTPNCAYEGKLLIEVIGSPNIQYLTPTSLSICPTNPQTIKIQPLDSVTYQWYYRSLNGTSDSKLANQTQPQLSVSLSGYYYCVVTKGSCLFSSPTTTVQYETPVASIGPQGVVCDVLKNVNLIASPSGGSWSGTGITSSATGIFSPTNLINGKYPVIYTFKSVNGCDYSLRDTVLIDAIPKQSITKIPGDYCLTGLVDLKVGPPASSLTYLWSFSSDMNSTPQIIDAVSLDERTFVQAGYYQVTVANKNCTTTTDKLMVGLGNDLPIELSPKDSLITVCQQPNTTLTVSSLRSGASFDWFFKETLSSDSLPVGTSSSYTTSKSGYFKVQATLGFCESTSNWQHVKFLPPDSLFVPNVFTPNGDTHNDEFLVSTMLSDYTLLVLNRYGQEIFTSRNSNPPWNGGQNPAGVYYWYVQYFDCAGKEKSLKGFVQLIR